MSGWRRFTLYCSWSHQHRIPFQLLEFFPELLHWGCSSHSWSQNCHLITVKSVALSTDPEMCSLLLCWCYRWGVTQSSNPPCRSWIYHLQKNTRGVQAWIGRLAKAGSPLLGLTKKRQNKCCSYLNIGLVHDWNTCTVKCFDPIALLERINSKMLSFTVEFVQMCTR